MLRTAAARPGGAERSAERTGGGRGAARGANSRELCQRRIQSTRGGGRGATHCRLELGGYGKQFSCGSEFCLYCLWLGPIPANDVRAARVGCALSSAAVRDRRLRSRGGTLHSQGPQRRGLPASKRPSQAARRLGLLERPRLAAVRAVLTLAPHAAAGAARRCADVAAATGLRRPRPSDGAVLPVRAAAHPTIPMENHFM